MLRDMRIKFYYPFLKIVKKIFFQKIKNIIEKLGRLPNVLKADVSGSGSACFALFSSKDDAQNALSKIQNYQCVITKLGIESFYPLPLN